MGCSGLVNSTLGLQELAVVTRGVRLNRVLQFFRKYWPNGPPCDNIPADRPGRFAVRPESFPDNGSARIAARPAAKYAPPGASINANHADAARRTERHNGLVAQRFGHELPENRCRQSAAGSVTQTACLAIIAKIDAGNDVGRSAYKPDIGRARRRACFAEHGGGSDRAGLSPFRAE